MKKITDSLLNRIVRQSLNENYGLLNEKTYTIPQLTDSKGTKYYNVSVDVNPCPDGGFCINDKNGLWSAKQLNKKLSPVVCPANFDGTNTTPGINLVNTLKSNCGKLKYGSVNEDIVRKAVEDIGYEYGATNTDEDKVKRSILSLNYPQWCKAITMAKEKGFADGNNFWNLTTVGDDDYCKYVANPSLEVFRRTVTKTDTMSTEFWNSVAKGVQGKNKSKEDLLVTAKKCGWNSVDEYKENGFKCDGPAYTPGGGGNSANQVSFAGYECISEHPALIKTSIKIDKGVGYKLNTGNKTIDSFVFGIQKQGDGDTAIDQGVIVRPDSGIAVNIDCTSKYLQHSLSTTVWNYDAIIDEKGKIALTTDPAREDAFTNESYKHKSFRYNLLTEAPTGTTTGNTVFELSVAKKSKGSDVKLIQQKLGLKDDGSFGLGTEAAVKTFQEKYKTQLTTSTPGIVDQATFDLIKKLKDTNAKKVYSGQKHNYVAGNWIKVTPETQDPQLTGNDGYFKITSVTDYTVVIDTDFVSPSTTGGSTQRVLFGEDAKEGTQEVIKKDRNNNDNDNKGRRNNSGTKSYNGNIDPEKQKQRKLRNQETCNTLREIKQYLNNTKGLSMTVNCKWNQEIRNQVMISLTGGTPVTPVTPVDTNTQTSGGGSVTVY